MVQRSTPEDPVAMPDPVKVLSDNALREIEALEEKAFFSLQGRFQGSFVPMTVMQRDALCQTVRALRADERQGELCEECEQWSNNQDGSPRTFMVCGACWNKLQETNAALREQLALSERESEEFKRLAEGEVARLSKQLARAQADVAKFSELADKRHDELWQARRQRDDIASQLAEAHSWIDRKNAAIETWQQRAKENAAQLAQVTQELNEYRERLLKATETEVEI